VITNQGCIGSAAPRSGPQTAFEEITMPPAVSGPRASPNRTFGAFAGETGYRAVQPPSIISV
jgi:hypothetical protein